MQSEKVGDVLFTHEQPGSTRAAIALFSQATEDPNPIHIDLAFAQSCGFPQVIQQGPMTTAHFARLLAAKVGVQRLKVLDLTFTAPVFPEEPLSLTATIAKVEEDTTVDLSAAKRDGTVTAKGFAVLGRNDAS